MAICGIISGGPFAEFTSIDKCNFLIACDLGYKYCLDNNIKPDLIIGDFDSYSGNLDVNIKTIKLPTVKDDTDTHYAFKWAIEKGFDEIYLYCALGKRLDHSISNIQSAIFSAKHHVDVTIFAKDNILIITDKNEIAIKDIPNYNFSVFAIDRLKKVSINGAKYNVNDIELRNDFPLGQSNEFINDEVIIHKSDGIILLVLSKFVNEL